MPKTSRVRGAELSFFAERIDIPLAALKETVNAKGAGVGLEGLEIQTPKLEGVLEIAAVRELALKEILRHADSGRARVRLKLPARTFRVGPLAMELREGTEAIIDLDVRRAEILRESTKGTIEPPISLPLGMTFRGLYLNDDGDVIADIAGFPDLNLSQLTTKVPRIPGTLDELIALLFDERPSTGEEPAFDASGLVVEARDVVPRAEAFHLGDAGVLMLGPETRLDVDYSAGELAVRGRVQLLDAHLRGVGFAVEGLAGQGTLTWQLDGLNASDAMRLDVAVFEARAGHASLTLKDGSHLELGPSSLGRSSLELSRSSSGLRFQARLGDLEGALVAGAVMTHIGQRPARVELRPTLLRGSASLSQSHLEVDLVLDGAEASSRDLAVSVGVGELQAGLVYARASGQLKVGTDFGVAFTGELLLQADVESGAVRLGEIEARLERGSDAEVRITQLAASEEGLDALVASGALRLRFSSGQLPLGSMASLRFSSGATGSLRLDEVERLPGHPWPRARGRLHIEAESAPDSLLDGLVALPGGRASVDASFTLEDEGHLALEGLSVALRSLDERS